MAAPSPVQSSPVPVQCECSRQQLHAALTLPKCRLKQERERVGKNKGIRGSSVSSQATCCLLGVHCRCQQPVHTPHLLKYSFLWPCCESSLDAAVSQRDSCESRQEAGNIMMVPVISVDCRQSKTKKTIFSCVLACKCVL